MSLDLFLLRICNFLIHLIRLDAMDARVFYQAFRLKAFLGIPQTGQT